MTKSILDLAKERVVLLDGGFGTELIRHGFPQGECPEIWNATHPDAIRAIHRSYFEAGADAVTANSFGGNPIKLAAHGLEKRCYELNKAAAEVANTVKPEGRFVGGSLGPTGKFLKPQGPFTEPEFEAAFAEQVRDWPTDRPISLSSKPTMTSGKPCAPCAAPGGLHPSPLRDHDL